MTKVGTLIVGGGVSGMTAAIEAARAGDQVLILEALPQAGKKLLATGNGRCNLMNLGKLRYEGDPAFAEEVLGQDPVSVLTEFWQGLGIRIRYDAEGRGYPATFSAASVLEALKAELKRKRIPLLTGQPVTKLIRKENSFVCHTSTGESFAADRLILACGGAAQPSLGGNLNAWPWLQSLGHRMIPACPALTPLRTDALSVSGLSGIRIRCELTVLTDGRPVHREKGELLFTDHGISGICVMQCSRYTEDGRSEGSIDLIPDLFPEVHSLCQELRGRQEAWPEDSPPGLLRGLCMPKMAYAVCKQAGLPLRGELAGELQEDQICALARTMKDYRVHSLRREGFERAQVMAGGADCAEFRPENLESRRCPGLHVTGELLNVDGDCGGFNLMFACATGIRAGRNGRM